MSRVAHISAAGAGGGGGGGLTDAELRAAPVVVDTEMPAAAALADDIANPTAPGVGAHNMVFQPTDGISAKPNTWSRWGVHGVTDINDAGRVPGVAIMGKAPFSIADTIQAVEVISVLGGGVLGYPDANQALAVAAIPVLRDASSPIEQRATSTDDDNLPPKSVPGSGTLVFDGTTWDRSRAGAPGADPGNTGVPAVQLHVSDGTNIRRVHSGLGDAASASTMVPSPNWVYNGATWDRMRAGTATGSVLVNNPTAANLLVTATLDAASLAALESITVVDGGGSLTVDGTVTATPERASTSALSNVAGSASSVTLLAANAARRGATIVNDSTAILYVKFGTTASTTSYTVRMVADAYYEVPFDYTGRIDGIWASATGNARITELTA